MTAVLGVGLLRPAQTVLRCPLPPVLDHRVPGSWRLGSPRLRHGDLWVGTWDPVLLCVFVCVSPSLMPPQGWPDQASAPNPHCHSNPETQQAGTAQPDPKEPEEPVGSNPWAGRSAPGSVLASQCSPTPWPACATSCCPDGRGPGPALCVMPSLDPEQVLWSLSGQSQWQSQLACLSSRPAQDHWPNFFGGSSAT